MDQSATTTALDVLSHAATLVEAKGNSKYEMEQSVDCRASPSKELPTREHKVKRNRDRRELQSITSLRIRTKSDSCSPPMASDGEAEKDTSVIREDSLSPFSSHTVDQRSPSPVMFTCHNSNNNTDILAPSPGRHLGSPPDSRSTNKFFSDKDPHVLSQLCGDNNDDQPLDMSKKCSWHSSVPPVVTSDIISQNKVLQQHRPSVITCASALLRTQGNVKEPGHLKCDISETEDTTKIFKRDPKQTLATSDCNGCNINKDARPGHRREILSGMCDPVIEEHFRRSLGKDYSNIFSSSSASVSVTVDDHFAKALGETWLRLQEPKQSNTDTSASSAPSPTKIPAQSQSSSASFLQRSPSNLNSLHCLEEIA